ncbi:MAG: ABC transporter ATP-binding protein [Phycisphaeraceae bacterium]|nr:ABC transporter ATP-binding protein [Phycisphaeraceae bacterium]
MTEPAIQIEHLSKRYRLGTTTGIARLLRRTACLDALRDVSFDVRRGEVMGVIGRNGAGKSTLLKILARITPPSDGRITLRGRVASLLEVGTGFHPELSGLENIYLNGSILGMVRREIRRKLDQIIEFSGVERFLDTPVKRYSSGMRVRLAFAVAAHLDPEILLIDEVLSVGDASFQQRCLGKMRDVAGREGRTVLFVSHNMAAVTTLCDRVVCLANSQIAALGDPETAIASYLSGQATANEADLRYVEQREGNGDAIYTRARLLNEHDQPLSHLPMGRAMTIELRFETRPDTVLNDPCFGISICNSVGQPLLRLISRETHGQLPPARAGGLVRLHIERLDLLPGNYYLTLGLSNLGQQLDLLKDAIKFEVVPRAVYPTGKVVAPGHGYVMFAPCHWSTDYAKAA